MCVKISLYNYIFVLAGITSNYAISIRTIVRLKCNFCEPNPMTCCIGTKILPNVILSTSFCAQSCQYIKEGEKNTKVTEFYINTNYKNFNRGKYSTDRNGIGLLFVKSSNVSNEKYLKLSAVDISTAIGLKALIPILDPKNPRLQVTVINKCEKSVGYYVCSVKKPTQTKVCPQEQGIPLLLNGSVIGISSTSDPTACLQLQSSFLSIEPVVSWIASILESVLPNYIQNGKFISRSKNIILNAITNIDNTSDNATVEVTFTENYNTSNLVSKAAIRIQKELEDTEDNNNVTEKATNNNTNSNNSNFISVETNDIASQINTSSKETDLSSSSITTTTITTSTITTTNKPTTINEKSKRNPHTAITANIDLLTTSQQLHSAEQDDPSEFISSVVEMRVLPLTTNVLQWFKEKMKKKLKKSPAPILILTTPAVDYYYESTKFVDLT